MTQISILILLSWIFIRYSLGIPNYSQNSLKYLLQNGEETEISIQPIQIRHIYKVWYYFISFNKAITTEVRTIFHNFKIKLRNQQKMWTETDK